MLALSRPVIYSAIPLFRSLSFAQGKPKGFLHFSGLVDDFIVTIDLGPSGPWPVALRGSQHAPGYLQR